MCSRMTSAVKLARLEELLSNADSALVAFSGGADSALLLHVSLAHLPSRVIAATAVSPLHPDGSHAARIAKDFGIEHHIVRVDPLTDSTFRSNPPDRCYVCKRHIFEALFDTARHEGLTAVLEGSNLDDCNEFRPGRRALTELGVRSPLVEAGLTKADVRSLSRELGLSTATRISDTCLATRFPYGVELTQENLERARRAEEIVRQYIKGALRVRVHGDLARIEVEPVEIARLVESKAQRRINSALRELGFKRVTVDLAGYRSGSMDDDLDEEQLRAAERGQR